MTARTFSTLLTDEVRARIHPQQWQIAPPVTDRQAWSGLAKNDVATIVAKANSADQEGRTRPDLSLWRQFLATGERTGFQDAMTAIRDQVASAALALAATGDAAWIEGLADGIWRLCEATNWCMPAHYQLPETGGYPPLPVPGREILDLSTGFTGALLAAVDSFAGARLEFAFPGLRAHVHHQIRRRVLTPWRSDVYPWHGLEAPPNNWAPWIVSNVLICSAIVEESRADHLSDIEQAVTILDRFRAGYAPDGGCDEGATYWWAAPGALFDALDVLHHLSGGAFNGFAVAPVPEMARFPMRMQISRTSQVNFADSAADITTHAYWHLLYRFGQALGDREIVQHARWMGDSEQLLTDEIASHFPRILARLRDPDWRHGPATPGMPESWFAPGIEVATMRERSGWFLAAKGGHNGVSHNHNDVGAVIATLDGDPILVDAGVGQYRRQTFDSTLRYGIWTMRSAFHSLPLPRPETVTADLPSETDFPVPLGGVDQSFGANFAARTTEFSDDGALACLRTDIVGAYPSHAHLLTCVRTASLHRGSTAGQISIADQWHFTEPHRMSVVLLTRHRPHISTDARADTLHLQIGPAWAQVREPGLEARVETLTLIDPKLRAEWGEHLYRTVLTQREPAIEGSLTLTLSRS